MQNKGFVKVIAVLLTLICCFYLSFSFVTNKYEKNADTYAAAKIKGGKYADDNAKDRAFNDFRTAYLDSMGNEKVYMWKTLKECQQLQIGLGLDLKGGMNVILEVSIPDLLRSTAGTDKTVQANVGQAVAYADSVAKRNGDDVLDVFVSRYQELYGKDKLGGAFGTNLDGISANSTDAQVKTALLAKIESAVSNANEVIRTRIDRFGVAQPNIQILKGRGQMGQIMVEMPGIKEPERVRKLLTGSANLQFWETYSAAEVSGLVEVVNGHLQIPGGGSIVGYTRSKEDTTAIMQAYHANKASLPVDLVLAWSVKEESQTMRTQDGKVENVVLGYALYTLKAKNGGPSMEGDVIKTAKADFMEGSKPVVSMTMTNRASAEWAKLTERNVGKSVAIVLDGYVYSAPNVNEKIAGGNSQISGSFTIDDTRDLSNVLNSGRMDVKLTVVQEETVGPSLGEASITAGLTACIFALVLLMIFMCLAYGFIPGMVANCALLLNFFFTFGVLTSFQAALTMSGIAGMVLSLGMAVDANVLIYERIKEELKAGKNIKTALADGYGNAFSAIFDSNLTSIITAVILYNFGTGPIRGFALTLGIGIAASFFTAVWMTRIVYEHFLKKDKWTKLTFTTPMTRNFLANTKVKFMEKGKKSVIAFGVFMLICVAFLSIRGLSKGIDFTGGRNYVIEFEDKSTKPEAVEAAVQKAVSADTKDPEAVVNAISVVTAESRCVRLTTNYRINDTAENIDDQVDQFVHKALKDAGLIKAEYDVFKDRQNKTGGSIVSAQKVGSSVAADMVKGAIISVLFALVAIFLYILVRFRNVAFSVGSVVALTIDAVLIIGMYSICWGWVPFSLEVDQTFIAAVLTAIGYSINDKVVVFDRIRENLGLYPKRNTKRVFNESINSTLTRTIMTSFTTLLVLLCIFFLGGDSIRSFSFAMILGVTFGTLSSIFLAAPIAYRTLGKKRVIGEAE